MCGCGKIPLTIAEQEINGKKVQYSIKTEFLVQSGKGKSSYVTESRFVGTLCRALQFYNNIVLGRGDKKRLLMPSNKNPVLARQIDNRISVCYKV